jgi:hypothetical protein
MSCEGTQVMLVYDVVLLMLCNIQGETKASALFDMLASR